MNLKNLRKSQHKSQAEVAAAVNISERTYSNYEAGKTEPDIETLKKLADYFHTTIDSLVGHEVPYLLDRGILSNQCNQLIDSAVKLTPSQCEKVSAYITGMLAAEEEIKNAVKHKN